MRTLALALALALPLALALSTFAHAADCATDAIVDVQCVDLEAVAWNVAATAACHANYDAIPARAAGPLTVTGVIDETFVVPNVPGHVKIEEARDDDAECFMFVASIQANAKLGNATDNEAEHGTEVRGYITNMAGDLGTGGTTLSGSEVHSSTNSADFTTLAATTERRLVFAAAALPSGTLASVQLQHEGVLGSSVGVRAQCYESFTIAPPTGWTFEALCEPSPGALPDKCVSQASYNRHIVIDDAVHPDPRICWLF
ncbi:MAG: hypothetical protein ACI8PZ_006578 [Myxococcota bacterium]|jgi:hypothetical protein